MKVTAVILCALLVQTAAVKAGQSDPPTKGELLAAAGKCDGQERFDIFMCNSHMCNDCTLDYCMKSCQAVQDDFPTCRCKDWPEARATYSGGDFAHKGKFGDA